MLSAFFAWRGARLMDRAQPGWAALIDTGSLNIQSNLHCILAQLYGSYHEGLRELGIGRLRAAGYGFIAAFPFETYPGLTRRWRKHVTRRMDARRLALAA